MVNRRRKLARAHTPRAVVIILLVVRIILFYKKKPAASPTAVPVMQGVAMPEATPAPTTVMPVATPVQATYA